MPVEDVSFTTHPDEPGTPEPVAVQPVLGRVHSVVADQLECQRASEGGDCLAGGGMRTAAAGDEGGDGVGGPRAHEAAAGEAVKGGGRGRHPAHHLRGKEWRVNSESEARIMKGQALWRHDDARHAPPPA